MNVWFFVQVVVDPSGFKFQFYVEDFQIQISSIFMFKTLF